MGNALIIEQIVEKFRADDEFSSGFFYKIRQRFDLLNPAKGEKAILSANESVSLLAADYVSGNRIRLEVDGALLVRFLATKRIYRRN
ncbi:hypothetical protein [Candidatus Marithrix sp. Canyon 246]|uniref:hypothetical protein n=1 Tax=Candidatus Marithrix sp. Canyon 246 TaxID=1827136 RepID=UPI00084A055F|nr:hypothetical protein [Candidatus Marithrix sp. Canyon 246]